MIEVRPFASLGEFKNGWLHARHHFSFGHYHDPARMGFGPLRVWNDDQVAPGAGFDPHPHRDMEIVTYVRQGAITHRDDLGNEGRTIAGDVQVMHAGNGIVHAEYNLEPDETRLFQIWLLPNQTGIKPGWATRSFPAEGDGLRVLASGGGGDPAALALHADGAVLAGTLAPRQTLRHVLAPGRRAYLVAASGAVSVNGTPLATRDGAAIEHEPALELSSHEGAEIVLVETW